MNGPIAYFSMEYALDDRLPIYAGGLGVLAGDHLRSASDLGLPIVAVGLLYREGYFRQVLDGQGRQREEYPAADPEASGLVREDVSVEVELGDDVVRADVWRLDVGRVPLYLLESNAIVPRLYTIDREERIRQEVVLGVGGIRALAALGHRPTVFHLNEGHAAFAALERLRVLVEEQGIGPDEALERVRATTVFTTHTPVPEGNEVFEPELLRSYLGGLVRRCGLEWDDFLDLGRVGDDRRFGLTPLALRTAAYANGVSELHGDVSRRMWRSLWPECAVDDVPIGHVTNGAHAGTWVSAGLATLLRAVGATPDAPPGAERWERARELDPELLWSHHHERKRELFGLVHERTGRTLDPELLTLGFARRFAPYKRATLLFSHPDRLAELPLQVLISGKSHPADDRGKQLVARITTIANDPRFESRVVFLPGYDLGLGAALTQGVDVWLNTPERPQEASGTSGMKAGMNGVLNLSVLDGWWPEAYSPDLGWAIPGESDEADAAELYRLLEQEVLPAYADRERWVEMMTASIAVVGAGFTSHRMVAEYAERFYEPARRGAPVEAR